MANTTRYLDPMNGRGPFCHDPEAPRPNILFISADMVPPEFYLPGAVPMRTPNLDALRDGHLFFRRAYSTSPLCSPSRAAYLTGRHSYITTNSERAHDGHEIHLRPDDIIFPEYLKALGYHLRHAGKSHVGAHKFTEVFSENASPWDRWSPPWHDDDGYIQFLRQRGLGRLTFKRSIVGRSLTGRGPGNDYGGWLADQQGKPFPQEATYPAYLVQKACDALAARPDAEQPFYLQLDFFGPHQPFAIPAGMEEREAELRQLLEVPRSYRQTDDGRGAPPWDEPRIYQLYRRNWGLQDPKAVLDYRVANQLQFELIDAQIGRLLNTLKNAGLYDNTWIFFVADHGEMNGELALIDKGAFLNPRTVRAPIIAKPAADHPLAQSRHTVDRPVSLLDLAATVLDIAGVSTQTRTDGVSLLQAVAGTPRPETCPILFEVWSHVMPNPCIGTVFTGDDGEDYLFSFNAADPVDELYALGRDNDLENRWTVPLLDQAITTLHRHLSRDQRWKSYKAFLELTYPDKLADAAGDRQLFF